MMVYRAPGERDACPACGSLELFDLDVLPLRAGRTGFVCGCEACGLVFSNPLPTDEELAAFYSPGGHWAAARRDPDSEPGEPDSGAGRSQVRLFDPIREAVNVGAPPSGSRVLDFGCGEGRLLDALQKWGWHTWGIEPATDRAFPRHSRLHAVPETPMFDLIVIFHVLEHVPNPLRLLRQLAAACRPGGHLFVGVPRFDTLPNHRDYHYVINGHAHITAYTWACLRTLFARSGWVPVGPPPFEVGMGSGGRRTTARMRVLARRAEGDVGAQAVESPAEEARASLRLYYAGRDRRSLTARAGLLRVAARRADAERRRAKAVRKAAGRQNAQPGATVA